MCHFHTQLWNSAQKRSWPDQKVPFMWQTKSFTCLCFPAYCRPQEQISLVLSDGHIFMIQHASHGGLSLRCSLLPLGP